MHTAIVSAISLSYNVVDKVKFLVVKQYFFWWLFKKVEFGSTVRLGYNVMIGTECIVLL